MTSGVEQRFQTLHEIVKAARVNLNDNFWDYLIGGAETEMTARRNRQALDSVAFRPRFVPELGDRTRSRIGRRAGSQRAQDLSALCPRRRCLGQRLRAPCRRLQL